MTTDADLWIVALKAEQFLSTNGYDALPIDPFSIADDLEIAVEAKPGAEPGVSGMLVRSGNDFGILYATHVASEGFQRFSVAHELGHYLLEGHPEHVFDANGVHASRAGFVSPDRYELEADHFAAGLLMPKKLFEVAVDQFDDGLAAVEGMADLCRTSLTATAIRYAQRATGCVAIVVSTGRQIDYCFMSEGLKAFGELEWLKKREPVSPGTLTQRYNSVSDNVAHGRRDTAEVDLRDWFGGRRPLPGLEEVVGLGTYGKTLTVLTCDITADDEDEDEELEESWEVRFRR